MAALDPTNLLLLACALLYLAIGEPGEAAILLVFVVARGSVAPGWGGSRGRRRPAHGGHGALAR